MPSVAIASNRRDRRIIQSDVNTTPKMTPQIRYGFVGAAMALCLATGCMQPRNSQDLKERTAEATANMKRDAKAVASGIREGWSRDKPLDLNSATKDQLMVLPGISPVEADRVIGGRPYREPKDLLDRHILAKAQYDRISDRITAK